MTLADADLDKRSERYAQELNLLATIAELAAGASDLRLARDLAIWWAHNLGVPLERLATVAQVSGQTVKRWSIKMDETRTLAANSFEQTGTYDYRCRKCEAWIPRGEPDWTDPATFLVPEDDETTNDEFQQELGEFRVRAELIWHRNGAVRWNPEIKWPPKMH